MGRMSGDLEQAIEFAEMEHKGGQHKFAEVPNFCHDCYKQSLMGRSATYNLPVNVSPNDID